MTQFKIITWADWVCYLGHRSSLFLPFVGQSATPHRWVFLFHRLNLSAEKTRRLPETLSCSLKVNLLFGGSWVRKQSVKQKRRVFFEPPAPLFPKVWCNHCMQHGTIEKQNNSLPDESWSESKTDLHARLCVRQERLPRCISFEKEIRIIQFHIQKTDNQMSNNVHLKFDWEARTNGCHFPFQVPVFLDFTHYTSRCNVGFRRRTCEDSMSEHFRSVANENRTFVSAVGLSVETAKHSRSWQWDTLFCSLTSL